MVEILKTHLPSHNGNTCVGILMNRFDPNAPNTLKLNGDPYQWNDYWLMVEYPSSGKYNAINGVPHPFDIVEEYRHLSVVR